MIQTCKVQLGSPMFCHMWQMQIFTQPKYLSLSSINAVKKLKNNVYIFLSMNEIQISAG